MRKKRAGRPRRVGRPKGSGRRRVHRRRMHRRGAGIWDSIKDAASWVGRLFSSGKASKIAGLVGNKDLSRAVGTATGYAKKANAIRELVEGNGRRRRVHRRRRGGMTYMPVGYINPAPLRMGYS